MRNIINKMWVLATAATLCAGSAWAGSYTVNKGTVVVDYGDWMRKVTKVIEGSGTVTVIVKADGTQVGKADVKFTFKTLVSSFISGSSKQKVSVPAFKVTIPNKAKKVEVSVQACSNVLMDNRRVCSSTSVPVKLAWYSWLTGINYGTITIKL